MRFLPLLFLSASFAFAQSAYVPGLVKCPAGQLIIATPQTSTLAGFTLLKFSCVQLDATVALDATKTPPLIAAIATVPVLPPTCGYVPIYIDAPTSIVWPLDLTQPADGARTVFIFADKNTPVPGTVKLWKNGMPLAIPADYSLTGATLQFTTAPASGDRIEGYYILPRAIFAQ